jgi:hypothetical protein
MSESETPRMLKRERNGGNKCEEGNEKEATVVRVQENRQRGIKANGRPGPGPSLPPPLLTRSGREGGQAGMAGKSGSGSDGRTAKEGPSVDSATPYGN